MRILGTCLVVLAASCSAGAQDTIQVRWAGSVDDASLKGPGLFSRLVGVIAGGKGQGKLGLPFDVEMGQDEYFVLARGANQLVSVDRASRQARVTDIGSFGLVAPVDVAGTRRHFYISDPELGTVFVGRGDRLERFVGREEGLDRPTGLALDSARRRLWVVDTGRHQLLCFSFEGKLQATLGARGADDTSFNYPTFAAVCEDGSVVINDTLNGKIKKFDLDGALLWAVGGFDTSAASLGRAKGVAVDRAGRIFVVDNLDDRVVVLDPGGSFLCTFGASGKADGELWSPVGIAVCGDTVVVADTQNDRLALFEVGAGANR